MVLKTVKESTQDNIEPTEETTGGIIVNEKAQVDSTKKKQ